MRYQMEMIYRAMIMKRKQRGLTITLISLITMILCNYPEHLNNNSSKRLCSIKTKNSPYLIFNLLSRRGKVAKSLKNSLISWFSLMIRRVISHPIFKTEEHPIMQPLLIEVKIIWQSHLHNKDQLLIWEDATHHLRREAGIIIKRIRKRI